MDTLKENIRNCRICQEHLPHGCNPIFAAAPTSKIAIIGQAPGRRVHESRVPWSDKSGDTLRAWLGVSKEEFYNPSLFALVPMGFCYPGTGKSGDLPPRKECAPQWHALLFDWMKDIKLTLLIGQYSQQYYLKGNVLDTLTETVENYKAYLPLFFPLPHPSPRNNIWMKKNPWFSAEILPVLSQKVSEILH